MTTAARRSTTDWSFAGQRLGAHLSLIFFGIIFMLPFLWMVSSSLKPSAEIFEIPVRLIPKTFRFANYPDAIESIRFLLHLCDWPDGRRRPFQRVHRLWICAH